MRGLARWLSGRPDPRSSSRFFAGIVQPTNDHQRRAVGVCIGCGVGVVHDSHAIERDDENMIGRVKEMLADECCCWDKEIR